MFNHACLFLITFKNYVEHVFNCKLCYFSLIEEGGDWDRRNRLKVYQGVYCMAIRDFKNAAVFFLDTVSTFTSYELMDYKTFVTYTVICSMISLSRVDLREKVCLQIHYSHNYIVHFFSFTVYVIV